MEVRREKFDADKMAKLKAYLEFYEKENNPVEYEITVDGFKSVRRTKNPSHFDNYKISVEEKSELIEIRFFTGASNNCDKVVFELKG